VPQRSIRLDSCEVNCEVAGEGRPVVLLHGLGGSTVLWGDLGERLARDYLVVSLDLRGAGATRELERRELSLETWAGDLRGVLEELHVERPVLVGHSLGASVALKYALTWPDDVAALVLMGADANLSHLAPRMHAAADAIGSLGLDRWVRERWSQNTPFAAASLERAPELLELYRAMLLANDPGDYVRTCLAIAGAEDLTSRLGEVSQPALVIVGGADDRTLPEHGRKLARRLPEARVVQLEGVGHTLPLEAPGEIAGAVAEFLGSLDGRLAAGTAR